LKKTTISWIFAWTFTIQRYRFYTHIFNASSGIFKSFSASSAWSMENVFPLFVELVYLIKLLLIGVAK